MLPKDEGKKREAERMALALNDTKAVLADVGVLRRIGDKALFSQTDGEAVVVVRVDVRVGYVSRTALQTVLAHHYGTALASRDALGDQENPVSEYAGPHIQHHFIAAILGL